MDVGVKQEVIWRNSIFLPQCGRCLRHTRKDIFTYYFPECSSLSSGALHRSMKEGPYGRLQLPPELNAPTLSSSKSFHNIHYHPPISFDAQL